MRLTQHAHTLATAARRHATTNLLRLARYVDPGAPEPYVWRNGDGDYYAQDTLVAYGHRGRCVSSAIVYRRDRDTVIDVVLNATGATTQDRIDVLHLRIVRHEARQRAWDAICEAVS